MVLGFVYLTGVGALLELVLINWAMQKAIAKGFEPMVVPDLVRRSVAEKCGLTGDENARKCIPSKIDLCLAGTAELLLGGNAWTKRTRSVRFCRKNCRLFTLFPNRSRCYEQATEACTVYTTFQS